MIDPVNETLISLSGAGRKIPVDANPIDPSTIWRWARKGRRGIKLETIRLGGRTVTSIEAVARFLTALNSTDPPEKTPAPRSKTASRHAAERAGKVLESMGV